MTNSDRMSDTASALAAAELRAETARRQMGQKDIAAALGMAQSSISEKYRGISPLTIDQFVTWCRTLDLDPADVLRRALKGRVLQDDMGLAAHRQTDPVGTETDEGHH